MTRMFVRLMISVLLDVIRVSVFERTLLIFSSEVLCSCVQRRSPGRRWSPRAKARVPDADSAAVWWETASSSSEEPGVLSAFSQHQFTGKQTSVKLHDHQLHSSLNVETRDSNTSKIKPLTDQSFVKQV